MAFAPSCRFFFHLLGQFPQAFALLIVAAGNIGGDAIPVPTEELMNRLTHCFAQEIPEGDINGTDHTGGQPASAYQLRQPHILPDAAIVEGVLADKDRLEVINEGCRQVAALAGGRAAAASPRQ